MDTRELTAECRLAHWVQVLRERAASGERVNDFCLARGITKNTYFYWQRKVREAISEQIAGNSTELTPAGMAARGFTEVKLSGLAGKTSIPDAASGRLCVEVGEIRIIADGAYPPVRLAELLKWVMPLC